MRTKLANQETSYLQGNFCREILWKFFFLCGL
uniref:Uncharacterized protein n=1 Tax=Rhizophora mucronata TaxID=61149 RepID=A0A2P2P2Z9_RHIMU